MALNPSFASASVNPSQTMGNDASAPAQGALPTGMNSQGFPIGDALPNGYNVMGQQNTGFSGLGQQPNIQEEFGVPSPFIIQSPTPNYNFDVSYPSINYGAMQQPQQMDFGFTKAFINQSGIPDSNPTGNNTLGMSSEPQYTMPLNQPSPRWSPNGVAEQQNGMDIFGFNSSGKYVGANMQEAGYNPFGNYFGDPSTQVTGAEPWNPNNYSGPSEPTPPNITDFNYDYYKSPQYQNYKNNPSTMSSMDHMLLPFGGYGGSTEANLQNQSYQDFLKNPSMGASQGAMLSDADRKEMNPDYVIPKYTTQDVQTAMQNPEFDSNYYRNANVLDDQGNPLSMDAKQQLIQSQMRNFQLPDFQIPYQDPQGLIGPSLSPIGLPQFTSPQQTTPPPPPAIPSPPPQATPTGTPPMATNPLSQLPVAQTAAFTPAPVVGTPSSGGGSFTQGAPLPNITTTQQQVTAAPEFYTDYLNQLAKQGASTAQNAQYVGATDLQNQAFDRTSQNVGNYQSALQNAINLAQNVGSSNLSEAIGNLGQANIARNLAPQATAGIVGSGQFGSKRGAAALGDTIANAQLGITAQQATALQQDMQNRLAASQQLGNLATSTQQLGLGDINALATMGGQKQTIAQNEQLFPMQQLTNQSQLLRGYTIPTSTGSSYTGPIPGAYAASPLQQIAGLGALGAGISQTKLGDALGGMLTGTGDAASKAAQAALSKIFGIGGTTALPSTNETNLPPIRTPDGVTATPNGDGSYTTSDGRIVGVDGNPIPGYVYPDPGGNNETPFPGNFDYNDTTLPIPTDETYNSWFGD